MNIKKSSNFLEKTVIFECTICGYKWQTRLKNLGIIFYRMANHFEKIHKFNFEYNKRFYYYNFGYLFRLKEGYKYKKSIKEMEKKQNG